MTLWIPKKGERFRVEKGDLHGWRVRSEMDRALWAFFDTREQARDHKRHLEAQAAR